MAGRKIPKSKRRKRIPNRSSEELAPHQPDKQKPREIIKEKEQPVSRMNNRHRLMEMLTVLTLIRNSLDQLV